MARVLVIEDDPDIRDVLLSVLQVGGHEGCSAADGLAGLAEARRRHPDLILLDLMMPVMDGWAFRAAQRGDPAIAAIPVVVVSAFKDTGDVDAVQYLQKPCELEDVLEAVERHGAREGSTP